MFFHDLYIQLIIKRDDIFLLILFIIHWYLQVDRLDVAHVLEHFCVLRYDEVESYLLYLHTLAHTIYCAHNDLI